MILVTRISYASFHARKWKLAVFFPRLQRGLEVFPRLVRTAWTNLKSSMMLIVLHVVTNFVNQGFVKVYLTNQIGELFLSL